MRHMYDEQAFIQAYDKYADAIFRYVYFRIFDRDRAQEYTQEIFTRTWQYLVDGKEVANLRAFLYQVARHLIIDESRKKQLLSLDQLKEEQDFDPGYDGRERLDTEIDARSVTELIHTLDEPHREVLILRYINGCKPKEIAEILGENDNVISVRIHRAKKQIQNLLSKKSHTSKKV